MVRNVIKRPLSEGGLGLRSVMEMNKALQEEYMRQFMKERDVLWKRVIREKFGTMDRGWNSQILARLHGKVIWKKVYMGRGKFQEWINWRAGDRNIIDFWSDC